jgi:protein-S-isoprenylcysteine O-methyltransferase Ste14
MPPTFTFIDWRPLFPGMALWAFALYLPLSGPLKRMEDSLAAAGMDEGSQQVILVVSSLMLALAVGVISEIVLCWVLGPGWASSLGLVAALAGFVLSLAARNDQDDS